MKDCATRFRSGRSFLVKVHGDIGSPARIVLGLGEFRRAIHDNRTYRIFLQDVFRRYTVLFLGYSLSDPDVLNMLDELVVIFGEVPGRHFALVDETRISRLHASAFDRNYGIQVLRYHKTAPTHPEVLDSSARSAKAPHRNAKNSSHRSVYRYLRTPRARRSRRR
jgi:hypothetical protein